MATAATPSATPDAATPAAPPTADVDPSGSDGRRPPSVHSGGWSRPIVVGLTITAATAGAAARAHLQVDFHRVTRSISPVVSVPFGVAVVLGSVLLVAVVGSMVRRRPRDREHQVREDDHPWSEQTAGLAVALAIAAVGVVAPLLFFLLVGDRSAGRTGSPTTAPSAAAPASSPAVSPGTQPSASGIPTVWWVAGAVAVLVLVALLVWRGLVWRRRQIPAASPLAVPPASEAEDVVTAAVRAGQQALDTSADPRLAVIACYEAMERVLAEAGAVRARAQTPEELLAAADARGLLRSHSAATDLVDLFGRARYSRHPMRARERAAAVQALAELSAGARS